MKWTHILILGLLFAALGAGLAVNRSRPAPIETRDLFIPLKIKIDMDAVSGVMIDRGAEEIRLERSADGWRIRSLWDVPVEEDKIQALLRLVSYIEGEQRSRGESLFSDYGLDSENAYHLRLVDGEKKEIVHLLIGTQQPDEISVFVRKQNDDAVYLTEMPLLRALNIYEDPAGANLSEQYWADLSLSDDADDFKSVAKIQLSRIENGQTGKLLQFEKKNDAWQGIFPALPFGVDQGKVRDMLSAVFEGQAIQVVDPSGDYGFNKNYWRLRLQGGEDLDLVYDIAEAGGKYYLRERGQSRVFEISPHQARRLTNGPKHFIAENPFDFKIDQVKEILMRYKESELFLNTASESSVTFDQILSVFENLELNLQEVRDPETVNNFADNVPYEIVLRHADGVNGKAVGFGEKMESNSRYPLQVQGDSRVFSVDAAVFDKIFLPFSVQVKTENAAAPQADTESQEQGALEKNETIS